MSGTYAFGSLGIWEASLSCFCLTGISSVLVAYTVCYHSIALSGSLNIVVTLERLSS
jgi:hypothetical protein